MSERYPTRAERDRIIAIDLLADWRPFAAPLPPPTGDHDWRYYGTITINGETGAFAWRAGNYGIGSGATIDELGKWDRIKIERLLFDKPPGFDGRPRFQPASMWQSSVGQWSD
jgi:hypothetical protein